MIVAVPLAAPAPASAQLPPYVVTRKVKDLHTYPGEILFRLGRVGSCSNPGGKCTIGVTNSKTTTLQVALGASREWVAAQIGASLSSTSAVSVSCTSPRKLKKGEVFEAWVRGVASMYRIQKANNVPGSEPQLSSWLFSYEPYENSIACRISTYG